MADRRRLMRVVVISLQRRTIFFRKRRGSSSLPFACRVNTDSFWGPQKARKGHKKVDHLLRGCCSSSKLFPVMSKRIIPLLGCCMKKKGKQQIYVFGQDKEEEEVKLTFRCVLTHTPCTYRGVKASKSEPRPSSQLSLHSPTFPIVVVASTPRKKLPPLLLPLD